MKPLSKWALFLAGVVLFVFTVSAATGAPPAGKVKQINGWVQSIAMSGPQVAYSAGGGLAYGPGDKVYLWNVQTGVGRLVSAHNPDPVYELAISRTRVAWIARGVTAPDPTAEIEETLFSASLRKPSQRQSLDTAYRTESVPIMGDTGGCAGDWIGGLVGSANLLAVNRWQTAGATELTRAELDVITPTGLQSRVSGAGSIVAQSTDGRRIAVLQSREAWPAAGGGICGTTPSPTVGVYAPTGTLLGQVTLEGAKEVALSGSHLVVLTKASRLAVYDWRTGRLLHSWRVPRVSWVHLEDVYGQIAVYSAYSQGRNLHLLQLAAGKDVLLTKGPGLGPYYTRGNDAQLEAPGLVYAVDKPGVKEVGKLVFVPMARVLAAVSKGHVR
jgi:hypothetical protein